MNIGDLQKLTITKLRDVALQIDKLSGVHGMRKEEIIEAIKAIHEESGPLTLPDGETIEPGGELEIGAKPAKVKKVLDKAATKAKINALKSARNAALESKDSDALKRVRTRIRRLKHQLRKVS